MNMNVIVNLEIGIIWNMYYDMHIKMKTGKFDMDQGICDFDILNLALVSKLNFRHKM